MPILYRSSLCTLLLLSLSALPAQSGLDTTEILVLGTAHLHRTAGFEPAMLDGVIRRLNAREFDVVCVEKMPGQLLYDIRSRGDSAFRGPGFGGRDLALADAVRAVLGLSFLDAEAELVELLRKEEPDDRERRRLFHLFLATTDVPSAALQLAHLGAEGAERVFTDPFDRYLLETVRRSLRSDNEYYSLAVPLARHRGLNRIAAIDNFQDEALLRKHFPTFGEDFQRAGEELMAVLELPVYRRVDSLTARGVATGDLSELYAYLNGADYVAQDFAGQWRVWLTTGFASGSDRARYSLWEMRNLQIAASILRVAAHHPGRRILVIIGASHKGFLEKYLNRVPDISLLDYE